MAKRDAIMKKRTLLLLALFVAFNSFVYAQLMKTTNATNAPSVRKDTVDVAANHRITFVELGSVNCIPCKAMQPVMRSIEAKYGGQVKVVFYDVWKKEQAHRAQEYKIRLIPTQVFLDRTGKELMRHEGFFPENQIDAFLQSKGLNAKGSVQE